MSAAKFHKGNAVRVRRGEEFRPNYVWRRYTQDEEDAWYASDASKGMDSAGESKLCPRDVVMKPGDKLFKVVRSRVTAPRGWGNGVSGCAQLQDEDGVLWYAKRADLY